MIGDINMSLENKKAECCEISLIHEDVIKRVALEIPGEILLHELADLFKVFGDGTRVRILHVLSVSEMCVCDIAAVLGMTQSAISHQLRTLKNARLVKNRRDGKVVYYSLDDEHVKHIFDQGMEHIKHR